MEYCLTDQISQPDQVLILQGLTAYNLPFFKDERFKSLCVLAREDGDLVGGIVCRTIGEWLEVEYLWVREQNRTCGIGSELLKKAEDQAMKRGCTRSSLYTYSFQAPDFYIKHGYETILTLDGYPNESQKIHLVKFLSGVAVAKNSVRNY